MVLEYTKYGLSCSLETGFPIYNERYFTYTELLGICMWSTKLTFTSLPRSGGIVIQQDMDMSRCQIGGSKYLRNTGSS